MFGMIWKLLIERNKNMFSYNSVKSAHKLLLILIFLLLGTSCQRNEVIKTHGISYLEKRQKLKILEVYGQLFYLFI